MVTQSSNENSGAFRSRAGFHQARGPAIGERVERAEFACETVLRSQFCDVCTLACRIDKMGNSDNTAINDLIASVGGHPSEPVGSAPIAAQGSGHHPHVQRHTTIPGTMPVAAPFDPQRAELPTSYPVVPRALLGAVTPLAPDPVAPTPGGEPGVPGEPAVPWISPSAGRPWSAPDETAPSERVDQRRVGTLQLRRPSELRVVIARLIVPVVLLVIAGVAIGGYFALGDADEPTPPATRAAEPAPTPVTRAAEPAPTPPAARVAEAAPAVVEPAARPPALVDVRIDSVPRGATVTLVDRGRSQFVGNTPVSVAVDPSREYELTFSHPGKPVQVMRLDARTTRRVAVTLGRRTPSADGAPRAQSAPPAAEKTPEDTTENPTRNTTGNTTDDAK
jgi:hypothetical protein